jgi:hypothetical protein
MLRAVRFSDVDFWICAAVSVSGRGDRDGDREAVTAETRHQAIENTFHPARPDNRTRI